MHSNRPDSGLRLFALGGLLALIVAAFGAAPALADCVSPAGKPGHQVYNQNHKAMQYCNADNQWIPMWGASTTPGSGAPPETFIWGSNGNAVNGNGITAGQVTTPVESFTGRSWSKISTGIENSCGLSEGALYCWGSNLFEITALGTTTGHQATPVQIGTATDWTDIDVGHNAACGIRGGALYCWGQNQNGKTGTGVTTGNTASPTQIGTLTNWTSVSVGAIGCGIAGGTLHCWGTGMGGNTPTQHGVATNWTRVDTGLNAACGIAGGALHCWGSNGEGVTGLGTTSGSTALPTQVGGSVGWTDVDVGSYHACGIRTGTLYCWGSNGGGATGLGTAAGRQTTPAQVGIATNWTEVEARDSNSTGSSTSCGISGGGLYCWGEGGGYGLLGNGTAGGQNLTPVQVGTDTGWNNISMTYNHALAFKSATVPVAGSSCESAGGQKVAGQCWIMGTAGRSCGATCSAVGGVYDERTTTYAGSAGTNANCQSVLDALGAGGAGTPSALANNLGCYVNSSGARGRGTAATTAAASQLFILRACGCNVGGDNMGNHIATEALNMNNSKIIGLPTPLNASNPAIKSYVDALTGINETDPQVGTITTADKWCTTDGLKIDCAQNAPVAGMQTPSSVIATLHKPMGVNAGEPAAVGAWRSYPLNRLTQNALGTFLTNYGVELPAGTYFVDAHIPFVRTGATSTRLYNATAGTTLINGTSTYNQDSSADKMSQSFVRGIFTLSAAAIVRIEYNVAYNGGSSSLGRAVGLGGEVYGTVYIEKLN